MRVGFVGLGKLGLPVATCIARGIEVWGYDPRVVAYPRDLSHEDGFDVLAKQGRVHFAGLDDVVAACDPIFVAVQSPHDPRYEGITPLPDERVDFDYSYLIASAAQIRVAAERTGARPTIAVISTVLPGTMEREVAPELAPLRLVYNPSFIAMGTTIRDFLSPEFVLLGGDEDGSVRAVYESCGIHRFYETTVANAELIKVSYNTFISLKLAFANTLLEVCHKTGCDVDEVTGALKMANRRLTSGAYLDGGMGDGGSCHPRDNIALSWLARKIGLGYDIFEAAMMQRERQAEWLADMLEGCDLPKGILGSAYKPGSHLTAGSHAILVRELLARRGHAVATYDPHVHPGGKIPADPHVWLVGCRHPEFPDLHLPAGSVVIDPWRYMPERPGVEVIRLGGG